MLLALAVFGFLGPNGVFLYYAFAEPAIFRVAMSNPITLVYVLEAFVLVALFAWFFHRNGLRSPGWVAFVLMSLIGSLTFSVPAYLYVASRKAKQPV
jgi:hypothetical protein